MTSRFKDPQEELAFINEMETELSRLVLEGLLREEDITAAREHYATRRAELEVALTSPSGRILPTKAITHRGTITWIAWVGVALVFVAALVFIGQSWELIGPAGRMGLLLFFTAAFYAGSWYLYTRTGLRRTAIALLTLSTGMVMVDIAYFANWQNLGYMEGNGADVAVVIFLVGTALFAFWAWRLDLPLLSYIAIACALSAANSAIEWGFSGWNETLGASSTYDEKAWDTYWLVRGAWALGVNAVLGAVLGVVGWIWGHLKGWRHATPLLFSGTLIFLMALVTIHEDLIPTDADGFLALFAALLLLWVGLASQRLAVSVASTIGIAAAVFRIEFEFFDEFLFRTLTLFVLGILIIAAAIVFERRRREVLDRLGSWDE